MISNNLGNTKNWFIKLKDSIFTFGGEIKNLEVLDITQIKLCEVTGNIQVVLKFNKYYFQIMNVNDILTNEEIIAKLSPGAARILTRLIIKELQVSEPVMQDLKLMDLKDDYLIQLYQDIKRIN